MFFSISLWGYYRVWRMERARLSPQLSRLTSLVLTLPFGYRLAIVLLVTYSTGLLTWARPCFHQ